jgi:hypothetical protein
MLSYYTKKKKFLRKWIRIGVREIVVKEGLI